MGRDLERARPFPTPDTGRFEHLDYHQSSGLSLAAKSILVLHEGRGRTLWVGTNEGLYHVDVETGALRQVPFEPDEPETLRGPTIVQSLVEDGTGRLWVGTNGGLFQLEPGADELTRYVPRIESVNLDVRSLRIDASGALWAGTLDGLSRLDTEDGTLVHYRHDPSDPHSLSHNHVHSLEVSRAGILWIATWSGLQRFEPDTERFTTFRHDPGDPTSVSNNEINRVYEDRTGTLWIGTWSGGVNRLDRDRKFAHFFLEPGDPRESWQQHRQGV